MAYDPEPMAPGARQEKRKKAVDFKSTAFLLSKYYCQHTGNETVK
jgi:hypothetical protein